MTTPVRGKGAGLHFLSPVHQYLRVVPLSSAGWERAVTVSLERDHCRVYCLGKQGFTQVEKRREPPELENIVFLEVPS